MNGVSFPMYRAADISMLERVGVSLEPYSFKYEVNNKIKPITFSNKSEENIIEIPGNDCDWDENEHCIIICGCCKISHPDVLFDLSDGIAFEDAVLGVAAIIASPDSYQRFTCDFNGEVINTTESIELDFCYKIDKCTLRSSFDIKTIIYLKKPSTDEAPQYYDNHSGSILAEIQPITQVYINCASLEFPTISVKDGRKSPLWKLETTWAEPLKDSFIDNINLIFNSDHPDYSKLDLDRDRKNVALLNEIYSSAIFQIILKIKTEENPKVWEDILHKNSNTIEPGSVCDFVCYIIKECLRADASDLYDLSFKLREKIYGGFK